MFQSVVEAVYSHASLNPEKLCLADDSRKVTYEEYKNEIGRHAAFFLSRGLGEGNTVVIEACQTIEYLAMELALLQFQARQVKVIPRYLPNRDSILQALLMGEGVAVFDPYMRFSTGPRLTSFNLEDDIPICLLWSQANQNPLIRLFADALVTEMTAC